MKKNEKKNMQKKMTEKKVVVDSSALKDGPPGTCFVLFFVCVCVCVCFFFMAQRHYHSATRSVIN
jgi:hypothetical protein